jgi:hypothetical protein
MLTKEEKETYINTTEADKTASIYSSSYHWIVRMEKLAEKYPDQVKLDYKDEYGAAYTFPKGWMKVRPPREISVEQRLAAADRLKRWRLAKQNTAAETESVAETPAKD